MARRKVSNGARIFPFHTLRKVSDRRRRENEDANATEHDIVKFLILASGPLTISGLAAMTKTGCNKVADAALRLEERGIVKRATRSRMIFLKPPRKEEQ